jgi:hypothetical protein
LTTPEAPVVVQRDDAVPGLEHPAARVEFRPGQGPGVAQPGAGAVVEVVDVGVAGGDHHAGSGPGVAVRRPPVLDQPLTHPLGGGADHEVAVLGVGRHGDGRVAGP